MALLVGENRLDDGGSVLGAFAEQIFGLFYRVLNQSALCTLISSGPLLGCDRF